MNICRVIAHIAFVGITISSVLASPPCEATELALVVGVSSYGNDRDAREEAGFVVPTRLPNAINDARLMHGALEAAGFSVSLVEDPSRRQLLTAINRFAEQLRTAGPDALGFFYFAGHGSQGVPRFERDVDNFLMPLGTDVATESDLTGEAVGLSRISATLSGAGANAVILVLDACRNFALPSATRSGMVTRGLAEARAYPGTMIAYSTAPGELALDGIGGGNGPYADALAKEIRAARGTRIEDILISVRQQVLASTDNQQTPWENASLQAKVTIGKSLPSAAVLPGSNNFSLGDLTQRVEVERAAWDKNLFEMRSAFNEVKGFEQASADLALKLEAWQRFLSAYNENNPYVDEDETMRLEAENQLRSLTQEQQRAQPVATSDASDSIANNRRTPVQDSPSQLYTDDYLPIVKVAPIYPQRALTRGIQGYCVVQYTVTRQGTVRDPQVVPDQCSSSLFHSASMQAAVKFKYRPRVVDGEAREVPNVRNKFTFLLESY